MSADVQFFCSKTSEDQKKKKKKRPQIDVQFSAQKQGKTKKKVITSTE